VEVVWRIDQSVWSRRKYAIHTRLSAFEHNRKTKRQALELAYWVHKKKNLLNISENAIL
jgi:hypothetical protein